MTTLANSLGIVKRNINRADKAAVAQLAKFGVATIHEAQGRAGLMKPYLRPIYAGAKICGTAVTVLTQPGDNWMLHVVAEPSWPKVSTAALSALVMLRLTMPNSYMAISPLL